MKIGDVLRSTRESRKIGLRELARSIGCSPTYLSHLERGKVPPPSTKFAITIATALDIPLLPFLKQCDRWPDHVAETMRRSPSFSAKVEELYLKETPNDN